MASQPDISAVASVSDSPSRRRVVAATLCLVALLSGCGADAGVAAGEPAVDTGGPSPLDLMYGSTGDPETIQSQIEEEIGLCMRSLGFDYRRSNENNESVTRASTVDEVDPGAIGFGIVASWLEQHTDPVITAAQDPNEAMLAELSASERDEWFAALGGSDDAVGCRSLAEEAVLPLIPAGIADEFADLELVIASDPRTLALDRAWIDCMAKAGYPVAGGPQTVADQVIEQLAAFEAQIETASPEAAEPSGSTPDDKGVLALGGEAVVELSAEKRRELDAIQTFEIGLAVATFDCLDDSQSERLAIRREHEAAYLAGNE